nr:hypothetical protein [uncultured Roseovarius sp.]
MIANPIPWPNGAKCADCITFDMDADSLIRLARWDVVHRFIELVLTKGDVWFARIEEIVAHVLGLVKNGAWRPRVDRLPYYSGPVRVR